jgi:predicted nucleic acid-binding protein
MLVDTDVLIWYLRGHMGAAGFLDMLPKLALSAVTYMELVQGCRNR